MCIYIYMYIYIYLHIILDRGGGGGAPRRGERLSSSLMYIYLYLYIYSCMSIYIYIYRGGGRGAPRRGERLSNSLIYIYVCIHTHIYIYTEVRSHEQALVCLSNREIVDASRWCTFHCKIANNRVFLSLFWPNLFSHLAAFNYDGLCAPSLRVDGFFY